MTPEEQRELEESFRRFNERREQQREHEERMRASRKRTAEAQREIAKIKRELKDLEKTEKMMRDPWWYEFIPGDGVVVGVIIVAIIWLAISVSDGGGPPSQRSPSSNPNGGGSGYGGSTVNRRGITDGDWNAMTPSEQRRYDQGMHELDSMTRQEKIDLINQAFEED